MNMEQLDEDLQRIAATEEGTIELQVSWEYGFEVVFVRPEAAVHPTLRRLLRARNNLRIQFGNDSIPDDGTSFEENGIDDAGKLSVQLTEANRFLLAGGGLDHIYHYEPGTPQPVQAVPTAPELKLPSFTSGRGITVPDGRIFILASSGELLQYHPETAQWSQEERCPCKRESFGFASTARYLYAIGGVDNGDSKLVHRFDLQSGGWEEAAPMLEARRWCAAATWEGALYVSGGYATDRSSVEAFDEKTGSWSHLPDMTMPRGGHGMVASKGRLVVVGGYGHGKAQETVEVFELDGSSTGWTAAAPLPSGRDEAMYGLVGETSLYIFGGAEYGWNAHPQSAPAQMRVECYDIESGKTVEGGPLPMGFQKGIAVPI